MRTENMYPVKLVSHRFPGYRFPQNKSAPITNQPILRMLYTIETIIDTQNDFAPQVKLMHEQIAEIRNNASIADLAKPSTKSQRLRLISIPSNGVSSFDWIKKSEKV